jgi:hypothetical protein
MNSPKKTLEADPFGITRKQVKPHPKYLWELHKLGFRSGEGRGGNPYNHST